MKTKLTYALTLAAGLLLQGAAAAGDAPKAKDPKGKEAQAKERVVELSVTKDGFQPTPVKVKKGEPLKLVITRKTEETCARDIVLDEYGINTALPMDKPVTVTFTPTKNGELRYGCAMGKMVSGVLLVE